MGSSSLDDVSFGDIIGSSFDGKFLNGNNDEENTLDCFGVISLPYSLSTDATRLAIDPHLPDPSDNRIASASRFSMDTTWIWLLMDIIRIRPQNYFLLSESI